MVGQDLPKSLVAEGQLMRDALINDLAQLPQFSVMTTHDDRLTPTSGCHSFAIAQGDDPFKRWERAIAQADYVWLIAPETDRVLFDLTALAVKHQTFILGCGLTAIEINSSKLASFHHYSDHNIAVVPTYVYPNVPWEQANQWVIKPDDGAGCEHTCLITANQGRELDKTKVNDQENKVFQPYIAGMPASISVLSYGESFILLSCNTQTISIEKGVFHYLGGMINGALDYKEAMETLVAQLLTATPDLQGYWGVDVILNAHDQSQVTLIEVNPRLTTAYVSLAASIGHNPAALVVNALTNKIVKMPVMQMKKVSFDV